MSISSYKLTYNIILALNFAFRKTQKNFESFANTLRPLTWAKPALVRKAAPDSQQGERNNDFTEQ